MVDHSFRIYLMKFVVRTCNWNIKEIFSCIQVQYITTYNHFSDLTFIRNVSWRHFNFRIVTCLLNYSTIVFADWVRTNIIRFWKISLLAFTKRCSRFWRIFKIHKTFLNFDNTVITQKLLTCPAQAELIS